MIDSFRGEYAFLSNFFPVEGGVEYEGVMYPTVENAFQAAKTLNVEERRPFETVPPALAKRMGKKVELRPNWDYERVQIMKQLVRGKFTNQALGEALANTGDEELVEGNTWHDNYWGNCTCGKRRTCGTGLNWLGRILMAERRAIQAERGGQR